MGIIINNPATATATSGIGRNFFKNPAFSVIQGTASGTLPNSLALPTASLGYPGESEWCIAASGGTPTYAFSAANQTLTFTGAAGITDLFLLQRIESRDANRLASKQVTLSIELSNSLRPTVSWELYRPTTTADTHGTIASPTQTLIASGTWTVTSTLTRYSTTVTLPSQVSNGLEVRIKNSQQTSGTWVIARPKLEEGSSATAFTCDDYGIELAKCKRYYQWITFNVLFRAFEASEQVDVWHPFAIQMFATPVASAIATEPNAPNVSITNRATSAFRFMTREGASANFSSTTTGYAFVTGYRSSMSAHIP
jgi:hypothetical protein